MTPREYLLAERAAQFRHEYRDGDMVELLTGSADHSLICANVGALIGSQLDTTKHRVYGCQLRLHVPATGLYTYADVPVYPVPISLLRFDERGETVVDPTLLVEVMSPWTEAYDRGEKFQHYRQIESLAEYVLVDSQRRRIEVFQRLDHDTWRLVVYEGRGATVTLRSIDVQFPMDEVYDGVEFLDDVHSTHTQTP